MRCCNNWLAVRYLRTPWPTSHQRATANGRHVWFSLSLQSPARFPRLRPGLLSPAVAPEHPGAGMAAGSLTRPRPGFAGRYGPGAGCRHPPGRARRDGAACTPTRHRHPGRHPNRRGRPLRVPGRARRPLRSPRPRRGAEAGGQRGLWPGGAAGPAHAAAAAVARGPAAAKRSNGGGREENPGGRSRQAGL